MVFRPDLSFQYRKVQKNKGIVSSKSGLSVHCESLSKSDNVYGQACCKGLDHLLEMGTLKAPMVAEYAQYRYSSGTIAAELGRSVMVCVVTNTSFTNT